MTSDRFYGASSGEFNIELCLGMRAVSELSRGLPIIIRDLDRLTLIVPIAFLDVIDFRLLEQSDSLTIALSSNRLRHFGFACANKSAAFLLPRDVTNDLIVQCAVSHKEDWLSQCVSKEHSWVADIAIDMMQRAQTIPSAICVELVADRGLCDRLLTFAVDDLERFLKLVNADAEIVCSSPLNLAGVGDVEVVLFREKFSQKQHVAIIRHCDGVPTVRLHSRCLFGDVMHSTTCDCWGQLRLSLDKMARGELHILLYLDQEGRDVGLMGKLLAYNLQKQNHDTWDANTLLGFADDARRFDVAAGILRDLGVTQCVMLTANKDKVEALRLYGIDVIYKEKASVPIDGHNAAYMKAKHNYFRYS